MSPFTPHGEKARWRIIYDLLKSAAIGEVVGYDAMIDAVGEGVDRAAVQMAARKAIQELERVDKRTAAAVPNEGYRIAQAAEHVALAERHNRKARTQIRRGYSRATNVDLNAVNTETRNALYTLAQGFAVQAEVNRRVQARQDAADEMLAMLEQRVTRLEREQK